MTGGDEPVVQVTVATPAVTFIPPGVDAGVTMGQQVTVPDGDER